MAARARPNAIAPEPGAEEACHHHQDQDQEERPAVLTVWRKSLLLSCSGYTVFDASGALAFRVDCYDSGARHRWRNRAGGDVVLMDVAGTPLLTVRRRRSRLTSLGLAPDRWLIFDGDAAEPDCRRHRRRRRDSSKDKKPFLSVRRARHRHALLGGASSSSSSGNKAQAAPPLAYVTPLQASGAGAGDGEDAAAAYVVEGSYGARACAVRDARGDAAVVAEVRPKERVGDDVFRLVAGPRLGAPLAVALVIALDDMFDAGAGSRPASASAWRPSLLRRTWSA